MRVPLPLTFQIDHCSACIMDDRKLLLSIGELAIARLVDEIHMKQDTDIMVVNQAPSTLDWEAKSDVIFSSHRIGDLAWHHACLTVSSVSRHFSWHRSVLGSNSTLCRLRTENSISMLQTKLRLAQEMEALLTDTLWRHCNLGNIGGYICFREARKLGAQYAYMIREFHEMDHDRLLYSYRGHYYAEPLPAIMFPEHVWCWLPHRTLSAVCEGYLKGNVRSLRSYIEALKGFKHSFVLVSCRPKKDRDGDYPSWDGNHEIRTHVQCRSLGNTCTPKLTKCGLPRKRSIKTLGKPAADIDPRAMRFDPQTTSSIKFINIHCCRMVPTQKDSNF